MDNMVLSRYLNEVHKILFEILCDIDRVCRDNSINYSLDSGTLLGAIREQGFIPWDDDADIIMLREEFEKFIKVYGLQKDSIFTIERDLWVYRIKGKSKKTIDGIDLSKICVDIFVLDNVPENNILYNLKLLLIRILQGMMKEKPKYYKYNFIEKVASFILHYFGKLFSGNVKFSL